jgi:hypothetical protein
VVKKYFPFIALLAAVLLFAWVKQHQRGTVPVRNNHVEIGAGEFNRNLSQLVYSKHARCRMDCRHIDEEEIKDILQNGTVNYNKIEQSDKGPTYPVEGTTRDNQHVRVVFAPHESETVVVTVIDLDKEWQCNCN